MSTSVQPFILSIAIRRVDDGVFVLVKAAYEGFFQPGVHYGRMSYAPFHDLEENVSPEVRGHLDAIEQALFEGTFSTGVDYSP